MYNAEKTILRCLNSVLNQTYKSEMKIIVVNDGSTDNSVENFIKTHDNERINK